MMKKHYLLLLFIFLCANVFAQTANVFWSVNQDSSPMSFPVATADITMTDGVNPPITLAYDSNNFQDVMVDVPYGTYDYTITTEGCRIRTGQVFVDLSTTDPNNPTPTVPVFTVQGDAVANVFWNVNETSAPNSFPVATAEITMTDGTNTYSITYSEFDNIMTDVPFGTYDYTITTDGCRIRTGQVTVDCASTDPNNPTPTVAVWEVQGDAVANVFWNVNETSAPNSFPVATAEITMTDGTNTYSITYSEFDNIMTDVPFGTYDYTITTDGCRIRTGQVTVDCASTDPNNPTPTVAVWEVQGDAVANVFWNVNETSAPNSFPVATAEITMTDGTNTYSITYSEFDNIMTDVPFGAYDYTITTDGCRIRTGQVTVDCASTDPNNPTPTVAVWEVQGDAVANVFWNVNETSAPNSFPVATAEITMTDGTNTYSITYSEFDNIMTDVPFGTYDYTITTDGCRIRTGQVTVDCASTDPNNPTPTVAVWEVQGDAVANVFWNVNETSAPNSFPVATAEITMTDGTNTYSITYTEFDNIMVDVPFGTYDYTITTDGCRIRTGQVTVDCASTDPNNPTPTVAVWEVQGDAVANVFWNVNETSAPNSFPVATAEITMTDGTNTYSITYSEFDNIMTDVPFGTYNYTISTDCHENVTGNVTVDCANIDPNNPTPTVAVWEVQGDELTTANVFWNVNETSAPNSFPVATAEITMTDGTNTYSITYSEFDNIMTDVPFGTYNYTISTDCHENVTGNVTVDCANIDPNNPTPTVAVWEVQGDELTTANVFWNVNETSAPNSFPVATAEITMTDDANTYSITYSEFDNIMTDVPFGTYNYTISTDCHEDVTGSVTVDCANIDPNNPTPTVASFQVQGDEIELDVTVTEDNATLTATESGTNITYQWIDCDNGNAPIAGETNQSFTATANGNYAVVITHSNCSIPETSECVEVIITSILETDNDVPNVVLFPNPVAENLTIKFENSYQNIQINLFSLLGQLVKTVEIQNSIEVELNMSDLPSGSYLVKMNADEKTFLPSY